MKRWIAGLLCLVMLFPITASAEEVNVEISAPAALLMEASTGQILYEKDADSKRAPASVTKIMTLLLIFDALDSGKISLADEVTTSEHAASMGGSQVYLEPGEVQTVETLIKCIAVASANDACVAMAEYISGSESEFVNQMNERAKQLGMTNTHFENCNGLEAEGHMTTAKDIALMSRELITQYPQIQEYCMIWQENIVHTTRKGSSEFGLSNTNKLVRHYEYTTGLKTGFTSQAMYCISATAKKNGIEFIAVIMGAQSSTLRNQEAVALLNYGFSKCQKYEAEMERLEPMEIAKGQEKLLPIEMQNSFNYIDISGADLSQIEKEIVRYEVEAPVKKGEKVGEVRYHLQGEQIGAVDIVAAMEMKKMTYANALETVLKYYFSL